MTDKVQKIREGIEKLKSQLIRGACSSQIAMETRCKEEAYNEVLDLLDTLKEELSKFDAIIQEGDDVRYNEDLGCRVNLSQLKRVAKKEEFVSKQNLSNVEQTTKNWKEPVSDGLEEACEQLAENARKHKAETSSPFFSQTDYKQGVIDGAKWKVENLWKPADGNNLPEIDREVIVLCKNGRVAFGHRPVKKFIARPIGYGRAEEYEVETYDKGGWNIPDVKYWLDVELPKEIDHE